jgi:alanine racemase
MSQDKASKQAQKVEVNIMTITIQMKQEIKTAYKALRDAYYLKETVFSNEFDKAKDLADCRMEGLVDTLSESSFGLYRLGLLPEEELNQYRKLASALNKFVDVAVEHFHNIEKAHDREAYYGHDYDHIRETHTCSTEEMVERFGTREEYIKGMLEDAFDDIDADLKDMLSYFNLIK